MKVKSKAKASRVAGRRKAKRVSKPASKIARGARAKSSVFSGRKEKTSGGLKRGDLVVSKTGKVVSKRQSASAKKKFALSKLKDWCNAVKAARKALGLSGFVPVGGKTPVGKALYVKAKSFAC